jgi:hypothetical protein
MKMSAHETAAAFQGQIAHIQGSRRGLCSTKGILRESPIMRPFDVESLMKLGRKREEGRRGVKREERKGLPVGLLMPVKLKKLS